MHRRRFLSMVGVAVTFPASVSMAQQRKVPSIGFLSSASRDRWTHLTGGFEKGLKELGYVDSKNVNILYRWAENRFDILPGLAADLVNQGVSVILAGGGTITAATAKKTTSTVPLVFVLGGDPVASGLVLKLNRPGGNVTGITSMSTELSPKRLELLLELVPSATKIGLLVNSTSPFKGPAEQELRRVVEGSGKGLAVVGTATKDEFRSAFLTLQEKAIDALVILPDPLFAANMPDLAGFSAKHRFPSIYSHRDYVIAGGLMSYGSSFTEAYREAGVYVARILNGENVGDLPVIQPTKFDLAINLGTAKEFGISAPAHFIARADEIIEH